MNDMTKGIFEKFHVQRVDGRDQAGEKHAGCEHFVLDLTHDRHALPAIVAYATSCASEYPQLALELRTKASAAESASNEFVTIPACVLPSGVAVPKFQVGRHLCSQGLLDSPIVNAAGAPWVEINYHDARAKCAEAGLQLVTETQMLAIALNIAGQAVNWSGGAVGEGEIYQGLHKGSVDEPQPSNYESEDATERRWHQLSTGERIYDMAGNAFTWVFDDVNGVADGVVTGSIEADSPSLSTAPFPSMEKGMGWRPQAPAKWSGRALVRGGCWSDGDGAGVFSLVCVWPDYALDRVGFRCTKPL